MLIKMVDNDLGVTLVPDMAPGVLEKTNMSTTQLPIEISYRDIGFAWRKGDSRTNSLGVFMQLLPNPEAQSMDT